MTVTPFDAIYLNTCPCVPPNDRAVVYEEVGGVLYGLPPKDFRDLVGPEALVAATPGSTLTQ